MHTIRLIHWDAAEAEQRAKRLHDLGYEVVHEIHTGPQFLRSLRKDPPQVFVIDLSRLPSRGGDVAVSLCLFKATRNIPIVFVDGRDDQIFKIQSLFPNAFYTTWEQIGSILRKACSSPTGVIRSIVTADAGKSLVAKMGIKSGMTIGLQHAPENFIEILQPLPENLVIREQPQQPCDILIWFVKSLSELQQEIRRMGDLVKKGSLWICWPPKRSKAATDLAQSNIRATGVAFGLVDYNFCSIDETWSGLAFTWQKVNDSPCPEKE